MVLAGDINKKTRGIKWANDTFTWPTIAPAFNDLGGKVVHALLSTCDGGGVTTPYVHTLIGRLNEGE